MELILILVYAVAIWVIYHKIFDVTYFDLGRGLAKEIGGSLLGGLILGALTLMYWWVMVIIIAVVAFILLMKFKRIEQKILVAVAAVIIAIAVAVTGISFNNRNNDENQQTAKVHCCAVEEIC